MEKSGRGPFVGSIVLALATVVFNIMQVAMENSFFAIFQTIILILFLVTVIYTFLETSSRDRLRSLSWGVIIFVFVCNVIISFIYNA
ncbi:hypothetical protein ACFQ5M_08630 [Agrilactobacillus yilanensis]|uniref:DUF3953 domain-containing protein n=1 Tax=Agrilactobacillus yilanensis TaxID=2485997 RepID=A0ABW4JAC3_9LACO|nr:hypothetical protein [Agrilactobacillus yilanensis]